MATPCAGVTATWAASGGSSVAFSEVFDVKVNLGGGLPAARDGTWTLEMGTVEVSCFGTANTSQADLFKKGTLTFSGGGLNVAVRAIMVGANTAGTVNDVARYTVRFNVAPD